MSLALVNEFISNPAYHDYLAILKGARNGFVYGVKVRFPHALVMSILFGRGECVLLARLLSVGVLTLSPQLADPRQEHLPRDQAARHESRQVCVDLQDRPAARQEIEWRKGEGY